MGASEVARMVLRNLLRFCLRGIEFFFLVLILLLLRREAYLNGA
jgi:hypothetical protein